MTVPIVLSTPAATAAKLGAKLGTGGSGLWHMSLRYKLFMLNREKKEKQVNVIFNNLNCIYFILIHEVLNITLTKLLCVFVKLPLSLVGNVHVLVAFSV